MYNVVTLTFSASALLMSATEISEAGYVRSFTLARDGCFVAFADFDCASFLTGISLIFAVSFPPLPFMARARVLAGSLGGESKSTTSLDMGVGEDVRPFLPYFLRGTG